MNFDIAGFQEVSFLKENQLDDLDLEREYLHYLAPLQLTNKKSDDLEFNIDGNAILIKKTFFENITNVSHRVLHLFPTRCVNMLSFTYLKHNFNVINCHLHHEPAEEVIRKYEIKSILRWLEDNSEKQDINLILGDFNCLPFSESYNYLIEKEFFSVCFYLNGKEPQMTFHNKIIAPFKDDSEEGTFDYIFVNKIFCENLKMGSVEVLGHEEDEQEKGIYASDHLALILEFSSNL